MSQSLRDFPVVWPKEPSSSFPFVDDSAVCRSTSQALSQTGKCLSQSSVVLSQTEKRESQNIEMFSQIENGLSSQKDVELSNTLDCANLTKEELNVNKEEVNSVDESKCPPLSICLPDIIRVQQLNHIDCLRMRNSLTEILEEVKLRRNNDVENEERIRHLVQEKYELERKLDAEKSTMVTQEEEHEKKSSEIRRLFEDKIKVLEAELRQNQMSRDCVEKEIKALKDDIRNLQVTNYNLEKKLREQGRKLQLQMSSADQHLNQLSAAEEKFKAVSSYCKKLSDSQDRLNRNVTEAVRLNKDLMYTNEHQKCIIEQHKREVTLLQGQLLDAKVKLDSKPLDTSKIQQEQLISSLKQQLQKETEQHAEVIEELAKTTSSYKGTLVKLQESHQLIERHLQNAAAHQKETTVVSAKLENCTEKVKSLETALNSINKELATQKRIHDQSVKTWIQEEEKLKSQIAVLSNSLDTEKSARAQLEQLNTTWSEQNLKLSEELSDTKAKLEVPREDGFSQTDLKMLVMKDMECQIRPELSTLGSQTEQARHYHILSQTEPLPCTDFSSQTFVQALAVSSTQTKEPSLVNRAAQTDQAYVEAQSEQKDSTAQTKQMDRAAKTEQTNSAAQTEQNSPAAQTWQNIRAAPKLQTDGAAQTEQTEREAQTEQGNGSGEMFGTNVQKSTSDGPDNSRKLLCKLKPSDVVSVTPSDQSTKVHNRSELSEMSQSVRSTYSEECPINESNVVIKSNYVALNQEPGADNSVDQSFGINTPSVSSVNHLHMSSQTSNQSVQRLKMTMDSVSLNSNVLVTATKVTGYQSAYSLNKEFIRLYESEKKTMIELRTSSNDLENTHFRNNTEQNGGLKSVLDNRALEKERNRTDKKMADQEFKTTEGKDGVDFILVDIPEKNQQNTTTLIEKPKKLSLYESHLDEYLNKLSSVKVKQNTVGVKLVKPRDNQDPPRTLKYVEYLQPTEKTIFTKPGDMSKVKSPSSSSRSVLSLVKRKTNLNDDIDDSKKEIISDNGKSIENRQSENNRFLCSSTVYQKSPVDKVSTVVASEIEKGPNTSYLGINYPSTDREKPADLSPYSKYKALLQPKVDNSRQVIGPERKTDVNDKKRGILKEFVIEVQSERDKKSVKFSENIVQVKHMSPDLEVSGDQSLFSDEEPEEEVIELIESQEDCSEEKRPRLA